MDDDHLVHAVFDGLPLSWETFLSSIIARENPPNFERLWHNCLQEEGQIQNKNGPPKEEHVALATRTKNGKRSFA